MIVVASVYSDSPSRRLDMRSKNRDTVGVMPLNIDLIRELLNPCPAIEYYEEIASTNERAMQLAREGAAGPVLIAAEYQTAGRGRRGAPWVAPAGTSVLCSYLMHLPTPVPPHHLAILSGLAVASGLNELGIDARIKWPNDIIVRNRKVGGILVETVNDAVVIGVGVNCEVPNEAFPADCRVSAGSLHTLAEGNYLSRESVLVRVIWGVEATLDLYLQHGIINLLTPWNHLNWLKKRRIRVSGPMGVVEGDGLFLNARLQFDVFKDHGVVPMPLSSTVEAL